jgi:glutathione S-transferase
MKALIALYETETPFTPKLVNLGDPTERAAMCALWPIGKFPILEDDVADVVVPESTTIIEYLAERTPGLIPKDPARAREARLRDRFFDNYVHNSMQKITGDLLRPADARDPFGVAQARALVEVAYQMLEGQLGRTETALRGPWAMGDTFTIADCAAAPALFYVSHSVSLERFPRTRDYLSRLRARPSFARVLDEARPYFHMYPGGKLE